MRTHSASVLILCCLWACGSNNTSGNAQSDRLQQTPQVNMVDVISLERTDFAQQLFSNGKLIGAARTSLSFGSSGPLSEVNVSNGKRVTKGTVLARVSRPDLELSLRSAEISLEKAEMDMYDYLVGQGYGARDTLAVPQTILASARMKSGYTSAKNSLDKAKHDLSGTVLRAPFSGRVADVKLRPHDYSGSEPFCSLIDDSAFDVDFSVMESEYSFLSVGQSVKVTPYADESLTSRGKITAINPSVDKNGQIIVRARVGNGIGLLDGMNVKVTVERNIPNQLVVPRSAVVIRDNLDVLFTYTDDGKAHWTYVRIVASNGDSHSVVANADRGSVLSEGDRIIISGNLNLADGSDVVLRN